MYDYTFGAILLSFILTIFLYCAAPAIMRWINGPYLRKKANIIVIINAVCVIVLITVYYTLSGIYAFPNLAAAVLWSFVARRILIAGSEEKTNEKIIEQKKKINTQQQKIITRALNDCNESANKNRSPEELFSDEERADFNNAYNSWIALDDGSVSNADIEKGYVFLKKFTEEDQAEKAENTAKKLIKADALIKGTWSDIEEALLLDIYKELTKEEAVKFASENLELKADEWLQLDNETMKKKDFKKGYFLLKYFYNTNKKDIAKKLAPKLIEVDKIFKEKEKTQQI
jgi:D-Tyr-tRNAtyr deacylase